jgi:formate hydrogenlyase subunit 4
MTPTSLLALLLVLALAPLLPGLSARTLAALTGRRGSPLLQPYADLARLLGKGTVTSVTTSWVFRLAPIAIPATALIASLLLPLDGRRAILAFPGDLLAFASLLALGRFALVLAGLDTGSSFEGMGASRELAFSSLTEPALLLGMAALSLVTGTLSLTGMLGVPLATDWAQAPATMVMVAVSFFLLLLAEAGRVPVDDPATHLELTMIHEVVILDHSGPDLALILYGGWLKFALFAVLATGALLPRASLTPASSLAVLVAGLLAVALLVGVVESVMARLRLARVPQLLLAASALAVLGVLLRVRAS